MIDLSSKTNYIRTSDTVSLIDTLHSYKQVEADLLAQDSFEEEALQHTLSVIRGRIYEIEVVWKDKLDAEWVSFNLSLSRHPSNQSSHSE